MKVTNNYSTITIESAITMEDLNNVRKYAPKALQLRDEKNNLKYAIMRGPEGSIDDRGIFFSSVNADGKLFVSVEMPGLAAMSADERKNIIKNEMGVNLAKLEKIEAQVAEALDKVNATIASIADSITCA